MWALNENALIVIIILKKGLTNQHLCDIIVKRSRNEYRGVEQVVARRAHNPKVVGSSPISATNSQTS